jgi:hypothetical protein
MAVYLRYFVHRVHCFLYCLHECSLGPTTRSKVKILQTRILPILVEFTIEYLRLEKQSLRCVHEDMMRTFRSIINCYFAESSSIR